MRIILGLVLISYGVFTWWFVSAIGVAGEQIAKAYAELAKPSPYPAKIVRFDGVKRGLVVPSWKWLDSGGQWAYASPKATPISVDFQPKLEKLTVTHGQWIGDDRADFRTIKPLEEMFQAAKKDGVNLLVTSTYRSHEDQLKLHKDSVVRYGADWAANYLEGTGKSEHQLGLAIDMTTYSPSCQANFDSCSISSTTANWLAKNAPSFGFILRYPLGKEHITGIAYESWHYRYVGKEMAQLVTESGLTFDELFAILQKEKEGAKP